MENKICIANDFIEGNLELTIDELYVFSHLWTLRTYENKVITSIDILNEIIELLAVKKRNKARIKATLSSIQDKQVINIQEKGKALVITFNEVGKDGCIFVPYEKVKELSPIDFFIYVAVAKWENPKKGTKAKYSYLKWAELLDCTEKTAVKYVNSAIEKGVIFKSVGSYNKEKSVERKEKSYIMQEINVYSTVPFLIPKPKIEETAKEMAEDVQANELQEVEEKAVATDQKEIVQAPVQTVTSPSLEKQVPDKYDSIMAIDDLIHHELGA